MMNEMRFFSSKVTPNALFLLRYAKSRDPLQHSKSIAPITNNTQY